MGKVRIKLIQKTASGARKSYSKIVTAVDSSRSGGYAFIGKPIRGEVDVQVGAIVITVIPTGPLSFPGKRIEVSRVTSDGLHLIFSADYLEEYLSTKDRILELVGKKSERSLLIEQLDKLIQNASEETLSEVIQILKRSPESEREE